MAKKLDWSKARADKLTGELISSQAQTANANSDKYYKYKSDIEIQTQLLKQGIWPTGKHQGTIIADLPVDYLIWAGQKLKSKHMKHAANNELLRRYHSGIIKI